MEFLQSSSNLPAQVMYKNKLQEYAQKHGKPLPIYQTVNEGFDHAPKFKSTVLVDGSNYESMSSYPTKVQAEQAVAKLAYKSINTKIDATECSLLYREPKLCKSILFEFAVKKNLDRPIYDTKNTEGPGLVYISSVALGGNTYRGEVAGSKKMAEQVAARATIESLLKTDEGILSQIIMSKERCHPGDSSHQKDRIERAVVVFNHDGRVGNPGSGAKRKTETNNWGQDKMRRTPWKGTR